MEDKRTITREVRTNMLYVGRTENKSMDRWFRPEGPGCSSGSRLHQRCFTFVVISESSVISQFLSKFASDGGCSRGGAGRSTSVGLRGTWEDAQTQFGSRLSFLQLRFQNSLSEPPAARPPRALEPRGPRMNTKSRLLMATGVEPRCRT